MSIGIILQQTVRRAGLFGQLFFLCSVMYHARTLSVLLLPPNLKVEKIVNWFCTSIYWRVAPLGLSCLHLKPAIPSQVAHEWSS